MGKFRKRPIVIEAMQLPPSGEDATEELITFLNSMGSTKRNRHWRWVFVGVTIKTLEGWMVGNWEDWVIKGVEGEFYPCKASIFEATYEALDG